MSEENSDKTETAEATVPKVDDRAAPPAETPPSVNAPTTGTSPAAGTAKKPEGNKKPDGGKTKPQNPPVPKVPPAPPNEPAAASTPTAVRVICEGTLGPLLLEKGAITADPRYVALLKVRGQQKVEEVK